MAEKPIKVTDPSQKYKLAIYAVSGAGMTYFGYKIWTALQEIISILKTIT